MTGRFLISDGVRFFSQNCHHQLPNEIKFQIMSYVLFSNSAIFICSEKKQVFLLHNMTYVIVNTKWNNFIDFIIDF